MIVTRFAPSPTGLLHLGHGHSALVGWRAARAAGGRFLLRIEDIDPTRCRAEFEQAIYQDLAWLGLDWDMPPNGAEDGRRVRRQSEHMDSYRKALARLDAMGVLYPCFCTRKDIAAEAAHSTEAPHGLETRPEAPLYPGICRSLDPGERRARIDAGLPHALRLDAARAGALVEQQTGGPLSWEEEGDGLGGSIVVDPGVNGDVVLARKEILASYHLAVTVDDAYQGVTLVTRSRDLFAATHVHRLLQALLGLRAPRYRHHVLLTNSAGQRLAKRDGAASLRSLREAGSSPAEVRAMAGFPD